jgi:dienelactone hydrolase
MEDRFREVEARMTVIEKAIAVDQVTGKGIEKRLDKIEDTLTWLVRLIIGAIILALVGFALGGGFKLAADAHEVPALASAPFTVE